MIDPLPGTMDQPDVSPHPQASWVRDDDGTHDQTLVETWLFRLRRERFRSVRSGQAHDFFVTEIADGVHTIAVTPEDQVVLVRQFRAASRRDSLETPGGLLEPGEDPGEAGARELLEETGYAGDPAESLGILRPNPALLTMAITTVVIRNARRIAEPRPDAGEELAVVLAPVERDPRHDPRRPDRPCRLRRGPADVAGDEGSGGAAMRPPRDREQRRADAQPPPDRRPPLDREGASRATVPSGQGGRLR